MSISYAVLEKTSVEFEKNIKNDFFSKMSHFETMNDMNMILLFYESGMARLEFLHSRVCRNTAVRRARPKTMEGGILYLTPLLSD